MNLKELASINGISISTAKRYKRDGINLKDRWAVEQHMREQRSRRGISKYFRRTASVAHQAVTIATRNLEDRIDRLESAICDCHFIAQRVRNHHPLVAAEMAMILEETTPIMEAIGARDV